MTTRHAGARDGALGRGATGQHADASLEDVHADTDRGRMDHAARKPDTAGKLTAYRVGVRFDRLCEKCAISTWERCDQPRSHGTKASTHVMLKGIGVSPKSTRSDS